MLKFIFRLTNTFTIATGIFTCIEAKRLERNSLKHEQAPTREQIGGLRSLDDDAESENQVDQREFDKRSYIKFWYQSMRRSGQANLEAYKYDG